jgi:hypothetical protein
MTWLASVGLSSVLLGANGFFDLMLWLLASPTPTGFKDG